MQVPAFCSTCGAVFGSGIELGDGVRNITMTGNRAMCPVCRSWGEIPDGVFNVTDGVLEILSAPSITRERLERFQAILSSVRTGSTAPSDALDVLRQEAPELQSYWDRIKSDPAAMAGWIAVILMVIQLLLSGHDPSVVTDIHQTTNVIMQQCVQHPQSLLPLKP